MSTPAVLSSGVADDEWSSGLIKVAAAQIKRYRNQRGLSAQQVADACWRDYGLAMKRSVLSNLESGRRPTLSLMELLVLAKILKVPPLLLVFPIGHEDTIEVLPGVSVDTWEAAKWFTGEDAFPHRRRVSEDGHTTDIGDPGDLLESWEEGAAPIRSFRAHEHYVREWKVARQRLYRSRERGDAQEASDAEQAVRNAEGTLWEERRRMRQDGLTPPPLPEPLQYLDDVESPLTRAVEASLRDKGWPDAPEGTR